MTTAIINNVEENEYAVSLDAWNVIELFDRFNKLLFDCIIISSRVIIASFLFPKSIKFSTKLKFLSYILYNKILRKILKLKCVENKEIFFNQ